MGLPPSAPKADASAISPPRHAATIPADSLIHADIAATLFVDIVLCTAIMASKRILPSSRGA